MKSLSQELTEPIQDDNPFELVQKLGDCYTSVGQYEQAQEQYEQAAQMAPDEPGPYIGLGVIAFQNDQIEQADLLFRVAVRLAPNNTKAVTGLAMVHQKQGHFQEAFQWYMKSLELDINNLTAILGLFQSSCQMGSFSEVTHYLEVYIQNHPNDTAVLFTLGALYAKDSEFLKAKCVLDRLIELDPQNTDAESLLDEVQYHLARNASLIQAIETSA